MFRPVQFLLYLPIQFLLIPFAVVGLIDGIIKGVVKSRKLGVSFSACRALQYKWFMHYFGTRADPLSVKFIKKFPCESHFGLLSTFGALILAQKLFGFTTSFGKIDSPGEETYFSFAGPRILKFDAILKKYSDSVEQIVVPGAGFDLAVLGITKDKSIRVFELDQPATIDIKVETLKSAKIEHNWITYIPVDYENESWTEKLLSSGFDKSKRTLFVWQSVSLFLEEASVRESLKKMAELCSDGSIVVQDLYSKAFISGEASKAVKRASRMIEKREPWRFGLDMSNDPKASIATFLNECGLQMTNCTQFGDKLEIKPYYCIIEAEKTD